VLDLGLPVLDGLTVLRRWRSEQMMAPVLILTARDQWHDKVTGIDAGADDYLTKPFHAEELLARVRALIRRASGQASSVLQCGPIRLDTRSARVSVAGLPVSLTSHEFKLLCYLMHHPNQVLSRSELSEHIYAQDSDRDSNTIEVFVARLRKKLPPDLIETVRGLGYRLKLPDGA
jgi:two-component system OmpR family response regulator